MWLFIVPSKEMVSTALGDCGSSWSKLKVHRWFLTSYSVFEAFKEEADLPASKETSAEWTLSSWVLSEIELVDFLISRSMLHVP